MRIPSRTCPRRTTTKATGPAVQLGYILVVITLLSLGTGCSFHTVRNVIDNPQDGLECLIDCPSYTAPIALHHPETGVKVQCGPYPSALYSGMAMVHRTERRQCVQHYQEQGYVRG
jgi:hypothetical protein